MEKPFLKNTIFQVKGILQKSIEKIFGVKEENIPLLPFNKSHDWDYQSAFANKLFNQFKKTKPEIITQFPTMQAMVEAVKHDLLEHNKNIIKAVSVSEQNFLLLLLDDEYLLREVNFITSHGIFVDKKAETQTVVVDFSSPNIAKEMHVGHLRSTILGESICRILEFKGFDVRRVNHLGDWGTQFGMLIAYLVEKYPNYLQQMPNLRDLEAFYKESKLRFDSDPEFKKIAQLYVVKLQSGNEDCLKAWRVLCDISREFYNLIYKRLDVTIEEFGESFYNPMIPAMLQELDQKGLIKEDQGARCIFVPKKKVPLMVVKKDGGFNYDTTDLAAVKYRLQVLKANRVIYLTDVGQFPHFELVFEGARMAGWYDPATQRLEHMGFGIILGENGERMKTRGGKTVRLMELIDEGKDRAKHQLMTRLNAEQGDAEEEQHYNAKKTMLSEAEIDDAAEILSVAAIKYFDMRLNRSQNYKFDFDNMLSQKGDTAVYLLYSYIRLCSIIRKSGFSEEELQKSEFVFTDPFERVLARHLVKFVEILETVIDELTINKLCEYLYTLSVKVAEAYHAYKINNNEHSKTRIQLIFACQKVMAKCFFLLSIKTIDKI